MPDEIVLVAGPPGGGKSTFVKTFTDQGYARLNRDEIGGRLSAGGQVYSYLRSAAAMGTRKFVLDNVYATRESRRVAIDTAKTVGLPIRILWLETTADQAQFFAARRQIQKYGKLFTEADYKDHRDDPGMFPPVVQFAYWKQVERPEVSEGFTAVDFVPMKITLGPDYINKALILDFDGTLRVTKSGKKYPSDPADIEILPGRGDRLREWAAKGYRLCGASNQSGCSKQPGDPKYVSVQDAERCFQATCQMLGVTIDPILYASGPAGVPQTYWRKPAPGMGIVLIERFKLDPARCVVVGDRGEDRSFAARCGFWFRDAEEFFA